MTYFATFDEVTGKIGLSHPDLMDEEEKAIFEELERGIDYFHVSDLTEAYKLQEQTEENECLICQECKRFWVPPVRQCKCGVGMLSLKGTHPDNKKKAENY